MIRMGFVKPVDVREKDLPLEYLINKCGIYFKELKRHNTTGRWEAVAVFFPDQLARYRMRDYRIRFYAYSPQGALIEVLKELKKRGLTEL